MLYNETEMDERKMEKEVFGYGGILYALDELKSLCPKKNELDETNKLYEFTKRHFETVYNSQEKNLLKMR